MTRRARGTVRIAVVGASTPAGARVREALAERGAAGSRVDLFGTGLGEAVLGEYAGEARLVQELGPGALDGHGLVFVCEWTAGLAAALRPGATTIDLTGRVAGARAVPHPVSLFLATLLGPVDRAFGVARATAVVLRPASDLGEPGLEELRDQTVRLLSFAKPPREVFGRQLAFNVIPEALLPEGEQRSGERAAREVAALLGWPAPRLALRAVMVPVFHGHAAAVRVETGPGATEEGIAEALAGERAVRGPGPRTAGTPLEAGEERRIDVSSVAADGEGAYWIWAVTGDAGGAVAHHALDLAGEEL